MTAVLNRKAGDDPTRPPALSTVSVSHAWSGSFGSLGNHALAKEPLMPAFEPVLVSVETARAMLGGVGKTTLYAMLSAGDLESGKLGKRRMIRVSSIHALADRAMAS